MTPPSKYQWPHMPPADASHQEWQAYWATRPFRLRHPGQYAIRLFCVGMTVLLAAQIAWHLVTGGWF
jgi:hypothetical protein